MYKGKAPVGDWYMVSDRPTSTQPYIFKVEYHHKTTLHTHCYSQCVSMCPTSTQPYIFKVEYQQVTTLKYTLLFTMCVHVPNFNPASHFQSGVSSGNNPNIHIAIHNVCPCAQLQPSPTFSKWSAQSTQVHFQNGVSSGNNPIHIAIHNVCPCAQLQPSPTFSKWSINR